MDHATMVRRLLFKMERRLKLGWIDHSPLSYDWTIATARATRIRLRLNGQRMTLAQVMA